MNDVHTFSVATDPSVLHAELSVRPRALKRVFIRAARA